jgi:hypothetical protein
MPAYELGPPPGRTLKKALLSLPNGARFWLIAIDGVLFAVPTEKGTSDFAKLREIPADRNRWRAVCGSNWSSATKETTTSPRQNK